MNLFMPDPLANFLIQSYAGGELVTLPGEKATNASGSPDEDLIYSW
jgi:hypothetical protein